MLSSAPLEYGLAVGFDLMDDLCQVVGLPEACFEESLKRDSLLIDAFSRPSLLEDREFFL